MQGHNQTATSREMPAKPLNTEGQNDMVDRSVREDSPLIGNTEQLHEPFPLTEVQYAYWIGRQGTFEISNIPTHTYLEFDGKLDPEILDQAWNTMIDAHPMLRAKFLPSGEQQIQAQPPPYHVMVVDLRHMTNEEREIRIEEVRHRMSSGAPPLDTWPHFEILVHLLPGGRTRLHFNLDMLVADAVSLRVLMDNWGGLYLDPAARPTVDINFRDYYFAERDVLTSEAALTSREYWRDRAACLPMPPELPRAPRLSAGDLRDPTFTHRFGELTPDDWSSLKHKAQEKGLTPASVLAAAFAETLNLWSAEPRFTMNTTVQRRFPLHPQVNDIIGDFTSTLLLELDWTMDGTFEERAGRCAEQLWADMDHPHVTGVDVLRQMSQAHGKTILNPIVFTCALGDLGDASNWAGDLVYHASETAQISLDNRIQEYRGKLLVSWDSLDASYPPDLMDVMHREYCDLLRRLSRDDATWGSTGHRYLPVTQEQARRDTNMTSGAVPDGLLHSLVLQAAQQHPERVAVISGDRTLTFGQLRTQAQILASELCRIGAAVNDPIAVVTGAGCDRVIAPLGVLAAGAPYLPIDPDLPADRLAIMMEDAGASIAVSTSELDATLTWPPGVRRVLIDRLDAPSARPGATRPEPSTTDTAYIIYTSGSTGRPKGVAIDHRGALNTIVDINQRFAVGPEDRVLGLSNLSFDLSVYDIFGVLGAGGTLVYPPADRLRDPAAWMEAVEQHGVTVWNTVPLLYSELVDGATETNGDISSLRLVLLSGDWIPLDLPARSRLLNPAAQLISLGGATEASIWSIFYPIDDIDPAWRSVPYGKPLLNQQFHCLDAHLDPCPDWVEGDLYIGGVGLAQGYWHDQDRTRASFIIHPRSGERLYRTGDRGRYHPDGNIEFLGRQDNQVKVRGFRIELGDVESNLRQHPDVRDCCVMVRSVRSSGPVGFDPGADAARKLLVAYVVSTTGTPPNEQALIGFLREQLPDYMVPARILLVERIPKGVNGKVDRNALPDPDSSSPHGVNARLAPSTDTERTVAEIWSELLDVPATEISIHDSFFELGGNSILLARALRKLSATFPHRQIQIIQLFECQSIERLGRLIDRGDLAATPMNLDRIKRRINRNRVLRGATKEDLVQPNKLSDRVERVRHGLDK